MHNINGKKAEKNNEQPKTSIVPVDNVDASGDETYDCSNQEIKCPNCNYIIPFHNDVEIKKKWLNVLEFLLNSRFVKETKQLIQTGVIMET